MRHEDEQDTGETPVPQDTGETPVPRESPPGAAVPRESPPADRELEPRDAPSGMVPADPTKRLSF
jgi:hypothetical protein